jgi:hypothetical protein
MESREARIIRKGESRSHRCRARRVVTWGPPDRNKMCKNQAAGNSVVQAIITEA